MYTLLIGLLVAFQDSPKTLDAELLARVRREAPAGQARIEAAYGKAKGVATVKDGSNYDAMTDAARESMRKNLKPGQAIPKGTVDFGTTRIEFARSGGFSRVVVHGVVPPEKQAAAERKPAPKTATCTGPDGEFQVQWRDGDAGPEIKRLTEAQGWADTRFQREIGTALGYVHRFIATKLDEVLSSPDLKITGCSEIDQSGTKCVALDFEGTPPPPAGADEKTKKLWRSRPMKGRLVLDPGRSWAVRSIAYHNPSQPSQTEEMRVEYAKNVDGIPIPATITTIANGVRTRVFSVEEFELGAVPDDQFLPTAFGLPPVKATPAAVQAREEAVQSRGWMWIAGGVVVAAIGFIAWRRSGTSPTSSNG